MRKRSVGWTRPTSCRHGRRRGTAMEKTATKDEKKLKLQVKVLKKKTATCGDSELCVGNPALANY